MTQREGKLSRNIIKDIKTQDRLWCFKQWGSSHTVAGLPDIIGVVDGKFFGLEVKLPETRGNLSPRQVFMHKQIRRAGGFVAVVASIAEARSAIDRCRNGLKHIDND